MDLGDKILELRKKSGLSQEQLGKINVTRQTISNWELGETSPNPDQLKLLSKAFNVSLDELLKNDINNIIIKELEENKKTNNAIKILLIVILVLVVLILFYYLGTFFGKFITNLGM